ncbi:MAG: family peptidase [Sediminibacterium sp.]|nr:family peptidase [Sediminibacterium sp.]
MRQLLTVMFAGVFSMAFTQKMSYRVSFPNAIHHEAHIELTASGIPLSPAVFRMSRSSPGRYATHEFGKNVYDVQAVDKAGNRIAVNRIDGDVYEVPKHTGTVTISYTLYGNYADGTYAAIDPESIHLNMPAAFMWMKGMDKAPIEISFDLPKENKGIIATQLPPGSAPNTFTAPGLQYFMDSPTKIGDLKFRQWTISNPGGKSFTMRIALESNASDEQADELAGKVKKIVEEARAVFGEFPNYDYGGYTFIASANPYVRGDGMEHRNSTMITVPLASFSANALLDVFSHEYFHNWNVERIRPRTLEPFNFEKSNMSNELWFAEGFTQYYGELLLARAGLTSDRDYLQTVAGLVNIKLNTPGAKYYSPIHASNHAVFVDASVSIDKNNYVNMFTSYYPYGAAIALALDLELQSRYHKTIDAYMQAMWKRFGKTELPYTIATMQETLASVSDAAFAADFFRKYIAGHENINYAGLLSGAGYDMKKKSNAASIGINAGQNEGKLMILTNTVKGSAAYEAGLDVNDEILRLDDVTPRNANDLLAFVQGKKPGDVVVVTYKHRNVEKQARVVLKEQLFPSVVSLDQSGKTVSDDMKAVRSTWFTSRVK